MAGLGARTRMRVDPNAGKLFDFPAGIHLSIEKVSDRSVIEGNRDAGAGLPHEHHIFYIEQIARGRDAESAHFRIAVIP